MSQTYDPNDSEKQAQGYPAGPGPAAYPGGAGYPGVASMDILGNVVPFIKNEEEKMQAETLRLLGSRQILEGGSSVVRPLDAKMTAHCNRVAVEDGRISDARVCLDSRESHGS